MSQESENPYVYSYHPNAMFPASTNYSYGLEQQQAQAQEWQKQNNPVGYTDQQMFEAYQNHREDRKSVYQNAMDEYAAMGYKPRGGKKRHNKKSKKIVRNRKAKSKKKQ
jgi:hypothetical protein